MLQALQGELAQLYTYYNAVFLLRAALITFLLSAGGCLCGLAVGLALAILRRARGRSLWPARWMAIAFVELFRRIPYLVVLMLTFFVFQALHLGASLFVVALVSCCISATAFIAEVIRGGLESVHANQWDAAATINMSYLQTVRLVILPQAWRVILPPAFSFFVLFIKDTALASQIGVVELTFAGTVLNNKGLSPELVFGTILVLYFVLSYPLARFGGWLEKNLARAPNREPHGSLRQASRA
ncbi:MAG: amino acid ABC transporter permease [Acetobacteraceae bacterium]